MNNRGSKAEERTYILLAKYVHSPKETVLKVISEKVLRIRNPMKRQVFKERLFTYGKKEII